VRDHGDPVGEGLCLVHVVRGQDDGGAERPQGGDDVPELVAGRGVEPGGRLVEEQQLGIADQPDPDVEASLLATGEGPGPSPALVLQPDQGEDLGHGPRGAVVAGEELQRLLDGERGFDLGVLQDHADPLPPPTVRVRGVRAEHPYVAAVATPVPLEDLDRGGLAGSVGSEQPEDLPPVDCEVHARDRVDRAVGLAEPLDPDSQIAVDHEHLPRACR